MSEDNNVIEVDRWKNRRSQAWIAFWVGILASVVVIVVVLSLHLFGDVERAKAMSEAWLIIGAVLAPIWAIVGAFHGLALVDDIKMRKP